MAAHPTASAPPPYSGTPTSVPSPFDEMHQYTMYYTTSRLNVRLQPEPQATSSPAPYYMQSSLSVTKPQLMLRLGSEKTSPMVAFAKIQNTSRHMLLGRGDCQNDPEDSIVWEELHREKGMLHRSDYAFSCTASEKTAQGKRLQFGWRKDMGKCGSTVYDCMDDQERVVARMASGGALNFRKGGELEVRGGLEQGVREMLIVSALAIWTSEAFYYQSLWRGYPSESEKRNRAGKGHVDGKDGVAADAKSDH